MRLFRVPSGKQASRRITQRNLYSVLSYVDRENPVGSRLLTVPNGPHGTAKQAIFSDHQASQYKRLVDWAGQFARQSTPQSLPTLGPAAPFEPAGQLRRRCSRKRPEGRGRCRRMEEAVGQTRRRPQAGQTGRPGQRFLQSAGRPVGSRDLQSPLRAPEETSDRSGVSGILSASHIGQGGPLATPWRKG